MLFLLCLLALAPQARGADRGEVVAFADLVSLPEGKAPNPNIAIENSQLEVRRRVVDGQYQHYVQLKGKLSHAGWSVLREQEALPLQSTKTQAADSQTAVSEFDFTVILKNEAVTPVELKAVDPAGKVHELRYEVRLQGDETKFKEMFSAKPKLLFWELNAWAGLGLTLGTDTTTAGTTVTNGQTTTPKISVSGTFWRNEAKEARSWEGGAYGDVGYNLPLGTTYRPIPSWHLGGIFLWRNLYAREGENLTIYISPAAQLEWASYSIAAVNTTAPSADGGSSLDNQARKLDVLWLPLAGRFRFKLPKDFHLEAFISAARSLV